jgi:hypothetical protein
MELVGELSLKWNVGSLPLKNFRVEGKCVRPDCDTTSFETNQVIPNQGLPNPNAGLKCVNKFVMNVLARDLSELCLQLKKREFHWPIDRIQEFKTPAVGANFSGFGNPLATGSCCEDVYGKRTEENPFGPDVPNTNEEECDVLTDVNFRQIPECLDFNVSFNNVGIKFEMTVERVYSYGGGG